jgi:hypothetical protein
LRGEAFEKLRDEVNAQTVKIARAKIDGAVSQAADAWIESLSIASAKGDHRPAKDLLLATKVVAMPTEDKGGGVQVFIGAQDGDVQVNLLPAGVKPG